VTALLGLTFNVRSARWKNRGPAVHPTAESNLCGHATLATAHALHTDRGTPGTVRFRSQSGILIAHTRHDGTITLDFPAAPPTEAPAPTASPTPSAPSPRPPTAPAPSATCSPSSPTRPPSAP
jgi:Phenazine biosynthesis-like protein